MFFILSKTFPKLECALVKCAFMISVITFAQSECLLKLPVVDKIRMRELTTPWDEGQVKGRMKGQVLVDVLMMKGQASTTSPQQMAATEIESRSPKV